MGIRKYIFLFVPALLALTACSKSEITKPDAGADDDLTANEWIAQKMRDVYWWNEEIPADDKLDYTLESDKFFNFLLSSKDGKTRNGTYHPYSRIEKKENTSKAVTTGQFTYGFEFQYGTLFQSQSAIQVLYVLPNSPAEKGGLKRGDIITQIDGKSVAATQSEYDALVSPTTAIRKTFQYAKPTAMLNTKTISITASNDVIDNPVYAYKVIHREGRSIGYMAYNHFSFGPDAEEESDNKDFDESMRKAFVSMKKENPTDFILDLRYNPGGYLDCAQLLGSMLVPTEQLTDDDVVFCNVTDKKKISTYPFMSSETGTNIGLKNKNNLYIITSDRTASASEAVINGLKPFLNVILVGGLTEGKNVASRTFKDDKYDWVLHPIVGKVSNSEDYSDYASGFPPDIECYDNDTYMQYDLGDEQEYLLSGTLTYIINGYFPRTKASTANEFMPEGYNSLDRRKQNAVLLTPPQD